MTSMVRSKFLMRLFAALGMVMAIALTLGVVAMSSAGTHAASAVSKSTPRYFQFHHTFPASAFSGGGLASWSSTFSSEGKTWSYSMVGTDPSKGSATTTIPVTIVPIKMVFSNGKTFDGTSQVPATTNSPIFKNASFISGNTQYGDAVARAEFWNSVSKTSKNYHVLLGTPTIAKTVTMNIPSGSGATVVDPSSGKTIGLVDINYLDPKLQKLLTSMHFTANMLPMFISFNVYATQGAPNLNDCCIGGYHNAVQNSAGLQTYLWTNEASAGVQGGFSEDISALSHETLEWFNDPFTTNVVPNWISPTAPQYGCNSALEVGDPLVGVLFTATGFSNSHLQDVALYNWFARQKPSTAINGLYTYLGTFTALSKKC
jgi:hypothetical protein